MVKYNFSVKASEVCWTTLINKQHHEMQERQGRDSGKVSPINGKNTKLYQDMIARLCLS